MRLRGFTVLLLVGGCWMRTPAPADVEIRMARDGEFPPTGRLWSPGAMSAVPECKVAGAPAPELYAPLVAYARAHLLSGDSQRKGFHGLPIEDVMKGHEPATHADGCYTRIVVDPRVTTGSLFVWQQEFSGGRSEWGAYDEYCAHVVNEHGRRTIVLESIGGMIGANERDGSRGRLVEAEQAVALPAGRE